MSRSLLHGGGGGRISGTACWEANQHNRAWFVQRTVVKLRWLQPELGDSGKNRSWKAEEKLRVWKSLCPLTRSVELTLELKGKK